METRTIYEVWLEGFRASGDRGFHEYVGAFLASSFEEACKLAAMKLARGDLEIFYRYYDEKSNTWWGCNFYDNEEDAAWSYG